MERTDTGDNGDDLKGWHEALPQQLPRPTYWPALLALGIALALLGPVTAMAITIVGVCLGGVSLAGWIAEMSHD